MRSQSCCRLRTSFPMYSSELLRLASKRESTFSSQSFVFTALQLSAYLLSAIASCLYSIREAALLKKFGDNCKPKRNLIGERHKFNTRRQNSGESVDHYITDLRTLPASCKYGSLVNDLVTSQLVAGISI